MPAFVGTSLSQDKDLQEQTFLPTNLCEVTPQVGLSRPSCSLPASSPGPSLQPGCVRGPGSCLTAASLDSAPAQLLAASVGPKFPQAKLSKPSSALDGGLSGLSSSPSDGVSGPPDPPVGSSRPSLGLPAAPAGPTRCEAGLPGPRSGLPAASPGAARPRAQPGSRLPAALPGPAFDFWRPLQAQSSTSGGPPQAQPPASRGPVDRPRLCLTAESPRPALGLPAAPPSPTCLPSGDFDRPSSCLPTASFGPAGYSRRPSRARFVPFGGLSRPSTSSSRPLQTQLQPPGVLSRPSSSSRLHPRARLLPHSNRFGLSSCPAPGGLCRPKTSSSHALPAQLRPRRWPLPAQLLALRRRLRAPRLPPVGSSRPSLGLPAAPAGPTRREAGLPGPSSGLPAASPGAARPRVGPSRASSCLPLASRGPASASLMAAPPDPALPGPPGCVDRPNSCLPSKANNLSGLSSCPAPASLCGPSPFSSRSSAGPPSASRWPAQMQPWLENSPCRPRSCLPGASPGPALAWPHGGFPGPGSCLPPGSLDRPSSSLTVACFGPTHASGNPPSGVSSCLTLACAGRGPPSRWAVEARLVPLVASPGPAPACWRSLPAQPRPRSGPSRPTSCLAVASSGQAPALWRPLQAQLLPPSGLCRPSSCLHSGLSRPGVCSFASSPGPECSPVGLSQPSSSSRRPLQAQVVLQWASPGPAPASRRPLRAQVVLQSASPGPALASRRPLQVHNFLQSASPGPAPPASQWPL
ncbi:basic proline-rich protein-like [Pongo pygmaeus]|uniref:basic proline-rich protein-like n=1 Tax=Pongo pygmaeus TaxID=9600 RepID=UPI00300CB1A3